MHKGEKAALMDLSEHTNHTNIIVTQAVKGGAVALMGDDEYIKKAERELNNQNDYKN